MTAQLEAVLDAAGIILRKHGPGNYRAPCPRCDRGPKDDALGVTIDTGGAAVWHCFRCEWAGGWRPRDAMPTRPAKVARVPDRPLADGLAAGWSRFWDACQPITADSPPGKYLARRCCRLPPNDVRWHPKAWHPAERLSIPAMVALITDILTARPISLHLTYLAADGSRKAAIARPRLYLGGHRKAGGVVRLWADHEMTTGLLIGEGLETVLSAARAFTPAQACLDAANVATFPVLLGIEALTIVADDDEAGRRAARECSTRWTEAGREVRVWAC
jgi:putative DNA primase/helicase